MSGIKKLSLLLSLSVFIVAACSRSEVTGGPDSEADISIDERDTEFSSDVSHPTRPGDDTQPPGNDTQPPGNDTQPPGNDTQPPGDDTQPPGDDTQPPGDDTQPPGDDTQPPGDDTQPPGDDTQPPETIGGRGLFYTPEELKEWNNRRLNGPYKANWDNRVFAGAQQFMTGKKDASPWTGQASASCWKVARPTVDPDTGYGPRGMWAGQAAFVYRVLKYAGDDVQAAAYFNKVKDYLLAHTTTPGINFKDGRRFCVSSPKGQGVMQFFSGWVRRLAVAYSWIKEDMSAADRAKFENWILGGGEFLLKHVEFMLGYSYSDPWGGSDPKCDKSACPGPQRAPPWLYDGGPPHFQMNDNWNNRASVTASAVGIVGLVTGDVGLRDKAKRYFELSLKYAVWPDGAYVDIIRVDPEPQVGFGYASDYLGSMCVLADALARAGDNSLYEYETRGGSLAGTESKADQPAKSIRLVTKHLAGQVDWSIKKYGKGKPRISDNVINPYNTKYGDGSLSDLYMIQPNLYYKNDYIRTVYSRTAPGTRPRAKHPSTGWDYYTGDWGVLPDVEFMWDGLAGQVWPYGSPRERKSVQSNRSPLCDSGQRECSADVGTR